MRIAIVSPGVLPIPTTKGGAVETSIEHIIKHNEIYGYFDITVYSVFEARAKEISKEYKKTDFEYIKPIMYFSKLTKFTLKVLRKLFGSEITEQSLFIKQVIRKMKNKEYDIVLIKNRAKYVLPLSKEVNGKLYLQLHNDYLNSETDHSREIYNACDKVIVVSEYIKKCVLTMDVAREDDIVIQKNCTDTDKFNKDLYLEERDVYRRKYGIAKNDVVIMFSGRIHRIKGLNELILAFKRLDPKLQAKLFIVGSSWYGSDLKGSYSEEVEQLTMDMKDKIIFTGFINYKDMPKIHSVADIAMVPSMWEEPAGRVVIEAMASGLPLIVTDSGGIPEYTSEKCAFIVKRDHDLINNLTKSMEMFIENEELRNEMGIMGKEYVQQYNTKRYYDELVRILKG